MADLIDLTHPLGPATPVFPGDRPVVLEAVAELAADGYRAQRVTLTTHSGTHVDAPAHLLPAGATLDTIPLEVWVGPALLLDRVDFPAADLAGVRRLLLAGCPEGIPLAWAARIVAAGVRLVGIDGLSFDAIASLELPVHRALLAAGVVLLENLQLGGAPRGPGTLYCLPLPVSGGDGAPARVLWHPAPGGP